MNIEEVKAVQAQLGITGHVVWFGPDHFTIAHTDNERTQERWGGKSLRQCRLHRYLRDFDAPPRLGLYEAQEKMDGWVFEPLDFTPIMDKTPLDTWVEKLESGEYTQAQNMLRNGDSFCCLGVACDIYAKETGKGRWEWVTPDDEYSSESYWAFIPEETYEDGEPRRETEFLPHEVAEWLGLKSLNGEFDEPYQDTWGEQATHATTLADKNDKGASFAEIASIVKKRPDGLA